MSIFKTRNYIESDRNFIFDTWMNGVYFGNDFYCKTCKEVRPGFYQDIPGSIFFKEYQKVIEKIMSRPDTKVNVACLSNDEEVALGYCVFGDDIIHWVFVKDSWRKMGIAQSIVPPKIKTCSHLSKIGRTLRIKYGMIFNPFL